MIYLNNPNYIQQFPYLFTFNNLPSIFIIWILFFFFFFKNFLKYLLKNLHKNTKIRNV